MGFKLKDKLLRKQSLYFNQLEECTIILILLITATINFMANNRTVVV